MSAATVFARVESDAETGCWNWTGHKQANGYGRIKTTTRSVFAHRYAYETFVGPIPDGLTLDHLCGNIACVNPDHLEPVTAEENVRRSTSPWARNANSTHCVRGHKLPPKVWGERRRCAKCKVTPPPPGDPGHGRTTTYMARGCRCDLCKAAMSEYNRQQYLKRMSRAGGAL